MASTALPHTTLSQETLQRQYMAAAAASPEQDEAPVQNQSPPSPSPPSVHQTPQGLPQLPLLPPPIVSSENNVANNQDVGNYPPNPFRSLPVPTMQVPDPYQYAEASVTSGSNSGEEDDRIDLGNKRLGGHLNGFSSKKRRKQSKPIRLGGDSIQDEGQVPTQSGQPESRDDDEEGLVNSTTPELEDGERRPSILQASDLPLNLSAAAIAGAAASHPTLRVLGAELLQNPDGGLRIPTSISSFLNQGMLNSPFGLPPFPFPFPPNSRGPPTSAGNTPPVNSQGRIQIFNPEAYCELCNKEFCNKYFLKTHKANKHGIYSEGVPMTGSSPTSSSPLAGNGGLPVNNNSSAEPGERGPGMALPPPPSSQASQGPPTPNSQAGSPFSGAFIAANMGSLRPPFVPLSPGTSPSPGKEGQQQQQQQDRQRQEQQQQQQQQRPDIPLLPPRDAPSREFRPEANDSPNGGGIRSQLPAALMSPRETPAGQPPGPLPGPPGLTSIPDFRQAVEERERLMQRESNSIGGLPRENGELRKSLESPQSRTPSSASDRVDRPPMPVPTSMASMLPGLPPHLNFNPLMFGGLPSLDSLRKEDLESAMAEISANAASGKRPPMIPNIPNIPNVSSPSSGGVSFGGGPPGTIPKGPFTPEKLRQMGVINADAFCEICCKEFCNKYFLRVHKLKKHGICSPDLPPEKVQKILNQMAKEAGKTGNPPPPIVRPPMTSAGSPFGNINSPDKRGPLSGGGHPSPFGPGGLPLRPPGLMSLPPLEPLLPQALKDFKQNMPNMPPPNFDNGPPGFPRHQFQPSRMHDQEVIRINDDSEDGQLRNHSLPEQFRRPSSRPGSRPSSPAPPRTSQDASDRDQQQHGPGGPSGLGENGDDGHSEEEDEGQIRGEQRPSEDLQRLQSMIMELNSGKAMQHAINKQRQESSAGQGPVDLAANNGEENTICRVCNRDMENKYFLRAHMMNEHGSLSVEDPGQEQMGNKTPQLTPRPLEPDQDQRDQPRQLPPPPPLLNGLDMANAQNFAAKFLQQMQKGFGAAGLPPLDGDEQSFLERVKSELAAAGGNGNPLSLPAGLSLGGPQGSPNSPQSPNSQRRAMEKDPNRKPASLSRSYCDICKKELCNKYFMKTHMLKMHGINIEATNSAGVNCHICKKELCSKYFLKVHMQNSHGLMEDGSPLPPHLKENGSGLFPGIFPPLGPPPHELLGLGGNNLPGVNGSPPTSIGGGGPVGLPNDPTSKEHYFSRLLGEQSEMSKEKMERQQKIFQQQQKEGGGQGGHTCSLCGDAFPEIVALQVHIIKSHGAFPPDSNLFGSLEARKISGPPGSMDRPSMDGSPVNSEQAAHLEDKGNNSDKSEGEVTPNKAPSTPALGSQGSGGSMQPPSTPPSSGNGGGGSGPADMLTNPRSHIEMLQRHMLSQQFPGLINPLLSGFPGFPGGPPPLAFANPLQQLLAGSGNAASVGGGGPAGLPVGSSSPGSINLNAGNLNNGQRGGLPASLSSDLMKAASEAGHLLPGLGVSGLLEGQRPVTSSSTGAKASKKRRFKCSKCQVKFKKREDCLRHIHAQHSTSTASTRRRLQFTSPKQNSSAKAVRNNRVRSHYVKRLMEILKVPTSRGTPNSPSASNHIMQAFLINSKQQQFDPEQQNQDLEAANSDKNDCFVPSMVYLPVARKINQPMTVAFNLTPA